MRVGIIVKKAFYGGKNPTKPPTSFFMWDRN